MSVDNVTIFFLAFITIVSTVEIRDQRKILEQYVSVCGMMLCNTSMFAIKPELDYTSSSSCPDCECDNDCWLKKNCCPDLYLSFPDVGKVKTNIVTPMNGSTTDTYQAMISTCPYEYNSCEVGPTLAHLFSNTPVFAGPYSLPFRSACFAKCNGYDVTGDWYLEIKCTNFYDLNYCSSFEEISATLHAANCIVTYTQDTMTSYTPTTDAVIDTCNVTGFWDTYDADIEKLCANVGPEMGRYTLTHSNVFCYMCNPSEPINTGVISTCNETGKWHVLDEGLREACKYYPLAHSEQPYKNWFCRMCNVNSSDPSTLELLDGSITLKSKTVADWNLNPALQYDVTVQSLDIGNIVKSLQEKGRLKNTTNTEVKSILEKILTNDGEMDINGVIVNITNLLFNVYLRTGSYDICTSSLLNVTFTERSTNCSCDITCIFSDTDVCCPDVALLYTKCIDQFELSTNPPEKNFKKLLVISECPTNCDNDVIIHLCQNDDSTYGSIPVESNASRLVFKNVFCAICHLNKDQSDSYGDLLTQLRFYTLRLVCLLPIPFQNEVSIDRIVSRAKTEGCVIQYVPARLPFTCHAQKGQCDKVKLWTEKDPDVQWACERIDFFPLVRNIGNIFCNICNPISTIPSIIRMCNQTGHWRNTEQGLDAACRSYPAIQVLAPYKNGLCQRCNEPVWSRGFTTNSMTVGTVSDFPPLVSYLSPKNTIRSFFTTYYEQPNDNDEVRVKCQHHQIYDTWKNKCRDVRCTPGRHIYNHTCIPLLKTTTNLSYSLSLGLQGRINQTEIHITDLLEGMAHLVQQYLARILNVSYGNITLSSFLTLSNVACPHRSSVIQRGTHLDIIFSTHFEIKTEYVNRFETEKKLLELPGQMMNVMFLKETISFKISENPTAFTLPILIQKTSRHVQCYVWQTTASHFSPRRSYRRSVVSQLLRCRQVQLDTDEYAIDENGMVLTFANSEEVVKYPEFELRLNGRVGICESKLPTTRIPVESVDNDMEDALGIFTLVLVCLSLLCLLVTFIPYYRFAYLRTLPGLNTVGLMATLFFVQFIFIAQTFTPTDNVPVCTVLGIVMHFLWLTYFAMTGVGTFHMYRVFVSDDYCTDDTQRYRQFRRYVIIAGCLALVLVVIHIGLTAAITGATSIGYGGKGCFMTSLTGKVLAFIVPVILICVWNTVFFVVTYRYISMETQKFKKVIKDSSVKEDSKFSLGLFSKLFILSGLTWVLQIIDGFFPLSVFSFIVTIVNASQGGLILYLNKTNFKKRKNRRRPGSTYTGSTSRSQKTVYSSSTNHTSTSTVRVTSTNTISETFQNEGFDSVNDVDTSPNSLDSLPFNISVTSTSKIIQNAEGGDECDSIRSECDSVSEDSCNCGGDAAGESGYTENKTDIKNFGDDGNGDCDFVDDNITDFVCDEEVIQVMVDDQSQTEA